MNRIAPLSITLHPPLASLDPPSGRVTKLELTVPGSVSLSMGGSFSRIDLLLDLVADATEQQVESLFTQQVIFVIVIDDVAQIE